MNTLMNDVEQFYFKEYRRILLKIIDETGFSKRQEAESLAWESTASNYETTVVLVKKLTYKFMNIPSTSIKPSNVEVFGPWKEEEA